MGGMFFLRQGTDDYVLTFWELVVILEKAGIVIVQN